MNRLDQTLDHFVDDGRITAELAADLRREYHRTPTDTRQRLAELAGYAGAGLAITGLVVIGSQLLDDIGLALRAGLLAAGCAGLLGGSFALARTIGQADRHPARRRLSQVMGVCSAILAALTVVVVTAPDDRYTSTVALALGACVAVVVTRWAAGVITTLAVTAFVFGTGTAALGLLPIGDGGPGPYGAFMVLLGALSAFVLHRWFPPAWLTRALGVGLWLLGDFMLLMSHEEYEVLQQPRGYWTWLGRLGAVVLVFLGTWLFGRGGEWFWALGAAVSAAMLVGLWSATALNAGVALVLAGAVLIATGLGLAGWRRLRADADTGPPTR